jgi:hypothetical protein
MQGVKYFSELLVVIVHVKKKEMLSDLRKKEV